MSDSRRIVIVEDEPAVSSFVKQALDEAGYRTVVAGSMEEAKEAISREPTDLVLLDVMLPDGDGFGFVEWIRHTSRLPVMMVTARDGVGDRVRGLDSGADDYLVKPFQLEEMLARVRALLRRGADLPSGFRLGDLEIDYSSRRVTRAGRVLFLSTTEYSVLETLASKAGQPVGKAEILHRVWDDGERDPNVVEVYVNYLRNKLERGSASRLIHTVRGKGYVLALQEPF